MVPNYANYYVTNVNYETVSDKQSKNTQRLTDVGAAKCENGIVVDYELMSKQKVQNLIRDQVAVFATATCHDTTSELDFGSIIHTYKESFLRTDRNEKEEDNLGDLPAATYPEIVLSGISVAERRSQLIGKRCPPIPEK